MSAFEYTKANLPSVDLTDFQTGGRLTEEGQSTGENFALYLTIVSDVLRGWAKGYSGAIESIVVLVVGPLLVFLLATMMIGLVNVLAKLISWPAAVVLDRLTWSALRRNGYGSDVDGVWSNGAASHPGGASMYFRPLPSSVAGRDNQLQQQGGDRNVDQNASRNRRSRLLRTALGQGLVQTVFHVG